MEERKAVPIWFFVGLILLIYGGIVLVASLHVPAGRAVASLSLRAGMAWGTVMMVFGGMLAVIFRPWRATQRTLSDKQSDSEEHRAKASAPRS
jgi:hypothetical protein